MIEQHFEQIEVLGLNLFFALIFFFIGMAIKDVLNEAKVPKFGKIVVWAVLTFGCVGFIAKGIIQFGWETAGIG